VTTTGERALLVRLPYDEARPGFFRGRPSAATLRHFCDVAMERL
jgi:hypothetical protein